VITLRTLGSLDLSIDQDGSRSELAHGKRIALLSYLAVARPRGFHRRDALIGLFWSEVDQDHARAALRQTVHFLRQTLGHDVVLGRGAQEVGLDFEKISCDAIRFEQAVTSGDLEQAANLYGGPLLHGLYLSDAPEFERWLVAERDRLAQLYADALRSLAGAATERGDPSGSARWWKLLAQHDPYSPEIACQLMAALDAAGDRAAAIEHAQVHAKAVRDGFEIEPDAAVLEFAARLREEPARRSTVPPAPPPPPPPPPPAPPAPDHHGADRPGEPEPGRTASGFEPREPRHRWAVYGVGAALLLIVTLVSYAVLSRQTVPEPWSRVSLGILPFENLGSADDGYFVAGLTEDLVHRLAGVQILNVVGPSEVGIDAPDAPTGHQAAALGAEYTLRATVERRMTQGVAESLRVQPSLIRTADGAQLWTDAIDSDVSGLFDVQARLAEEVTRVLRIPLLATEREWLRAQPTQDLDAYDLYSRANGYLRGDSATARDLTRAVELLEGAIELDTAFVQAHAKLAIAHTSMFLWNYDRSPGRLNAARDAANRAVRMRPDAPMSHLALGWYYYLGLQNYERALRHFELARAVWPGVSDVLVQLGAIRRRQGDLEQALRNQLEALSANPYCARCAAETGETYLMLRDFAAAEREATRALGIAPDLAYARHVGALARISGGRGPAMARRMLQPPEDPQALIELAVGRWGAILRILNSEYDQLLGRLVLSSDIADTAGFYLARAALAERTAQPAVAAVYYDSARVQLELQVQALPDDARLRGRLGLAYAGLGRKSAAVREGLEATRLRPMVEDIVDGAVASEVLARIYTMVGESDAAISRLEGLLSGPSLLSNELLRLDPVWAPLTDHSRFQRLIR
jgi:DNA-binding SARP family transcriptional activator/TolB-like protein